MADEPCPNCCYQGHPLGVPVVTCAGPCDERRFHAFCEDLTRSSLAALREQPGMKWFCRDCRRQPDRRVSFEFSELKQLLRRRGRAKGTGGRPSRRRPSVRKRTVEDGNVSTSTALDSTETSGELTPQFESALWPVLVRNVCEFLSVAEFMGLRLVCSEWKQIVDGSERLMARCQIRMAGDVDRDYQPKWLPPVRGVAFGEGTILSVGSWWALVGERLSGLVLGNCRITMGTLLGLLKQTPKLRGLQLGSGILPSGGRSLTNVQLDQLEELKISRCTNCDVLLQLVCPKLKQFESRTGSTKVARFLTEVKGTLEQLVTVYTEEISTAIVELKQLKQVNMQFILSPASLQESLAKIAQAIPSMQSLKFSCSWEQPEAGRSVDLASLQPLTGLQSLLVCGPYGSGSRSIDFNQLAHPTLQRLCLSRLRFPESLPRYLSSAANLRSVSLRGCQFNDWNELFSSLPPTLTRLEIMDCEVHRNDDFMPDYFDRLESLKISTSNLTKTQLKTLLQLCPNVRQLHLYGLAVDDEVMAVLARKAKQLRVLALSKCDVSDAGVATLVDSSCHRLVRFAVVDCAGVSSELMAQLDDADGHQPALVNGNWNTDDFYC